MIEVETQDWKAEAAGGAGERQALHLLLRVVADIGLVGLPNAGKSSMLGMLTRASPEVANYPFTTIMPNLGTIAGAAIDVYPEEPRSNMDGFACPLAGLDNVILTPHIGGSTEEAQEQIAAEVAVKIARFDATGTTTSSVNVPEVELPVRPADQVRILHFHRNVPGVLSQINDIFRDRGINIDGQFLRTDPKVGYVVIDVTADEEQTASLRDAMAAIDGTLRVRVLY